MAKSVNIDKNGRAKVEITIDDIVYQTARGLLRSEADKETIELLGYLEGDYATGDGFEIFMELGISYFINNKETLEKDLKRSKLAIFDGYPQIAKKEIEIIRKQKANLEGRSPEADRKRIRTMTEVIGELGEEYGGETPKNVLITKMSDRYNMSEEKVEEIIKILKRKGIIFEPKPGYLKIV
jgi:hypothetical protein